MDFNEPTLARHYSDFLQYVKDRDTAIGTMLFTADTNLPTSTIRYNRTSKILEEWSGSTWAAKEISGIAASAITTGTILDRAVTDSKIGLTNAGYLAGRNAANSGWLNIARVNSSDNVELGAVSTLVDVYAANVRQISVQNGAIIPRTTVDLGAAASRFSTAYLSSINMPNGNWLTWQNGAGTGSVPVLRLNSASEIEISQAISLYNNTGFNFLGVSTPTAGQLFGTVSDELAIGGANGLQFSVNGNVLWKLTPDGALKPTAEMAFDIGTDHLAVGTIYAENYRSAHDRDLNLISSSTRTVFTNLNFVTLLPETSLTIDNTFGALIPGSVKNLGSAFNPYNNVFALNLHSSTSGSIDLSSILNFTSGGGGNLGGTIGTRLGYISVKLLGSSCRIPVYGP